MSLSESVGVLTFHCVMRDKYPVEAIVLKYHINCVCPGTLSFEAVLVIYVSHAGFQRIRLDVLSTYRGLVKHRGVSWIKANSQQTCESLFSSLEEFIRSLLMCERVEINDREDQPVISGLFSIRLLILKLFPLSKSPKIIAQVRDSCGLNA